MQPQEPSSTEVARQNFRGFEDGGILSWGITFGLVCFVAFVVYIAFHIVRRDSQAGEDFPCSD